LTRKEAKAAGLKFYETGKPCIRGHLSQRRVSSGHCVDCVFPSYSRRAEVSKRWQLKNPDKYQAVRYRYRYGVELSEIRPKPSLCEICNNPFPKIVFDHCHQSGRFRGWICDPCNTVLGLVKDDTDRLRALIHYLDGQSRNSPCIRHLKDVGRVARLRRATA
jgi:hypothetical protein